LEIGWPQLFMLYSTRPKLVLVSALYFKKAILLKRNVSM
jgi:hypothetical protein